MKKAAIFYNGDLSDISRAKGYLQDTGYIICADGGAAYALQLDIIPHAIIGDLDSLSPKLQKKLAKHPIDWITFKKEKDETDSELAISHAIEKGYTTIRVFGLFGTRLDHLLTNIFAFSYLAHKGIKVMFIEGNQEIQLITDTVQLNGTVGNLVSLLPFQGDVKKVTTQGLQYPLDGEDLYFGYSRGLSNVMTADTAEISIHAGKLLVIHARN